MLVTPLQILVLYHGSVNQINKYLNIYLIKYKFSYSFCVSRTGLGKHLKRFRVLLRRPRTERTQIAMAADSFAALPFRFTVLRTD